MKLITADMTTFLPTLEENSVDLLLTDPPYGMNIVNSNWDREVPSSEMWKHTFRVLKPGCFILAFSTPKNYHILAQNMEDAGFEIKDMYQWVMSYKMPRGGMPRSCHEPIFVGIKPGEKHSVDLENNRIEWYHEPPKSWPAGGASRQGFGKSTKKVDGTTITPNEKGRIPCNVIGETGDPNTDKFFYTPRVSRKERGEYNDHPTPKPVALMQHLVRLFSSENETVLDPFMGSGSTGIACKIENREFIGVDLDQAYVDISTKRIKEWEDYKS
jgi:site-specific DNA-methyltransferase (adenine-specific)